MTIGAVFAMRLLWWLALANEVRGIYVVAMLAGDFRLQLYGLATMAIGLLYWRSRYAG
jgi:hypothetical protein